MNASRLPPTLNASQRDGDSRLVGLVFDSQPMLATPDTNPWLVAVDGSDNALRAATLAARLAGTMNTCALHLVYVQPWLAKEAAETELKPRAFEATERVRALLDAAGLPWRLHIVMGDACARILQLAAQLHPTGIVMGSRGLNVVESQLFGSVTYKVMHLATVPVMVVP